MNLLNQRSNSFLSELKLAYLELAKMVFEKYPQNKEMKEIIKNIGRDYKEIEQYYETKR